MFKISFSKPHQITITHGYNCIDVFNCDCGYKCKYRSNYNFHNWRVRVHRFFEYRLHIKLPYFLYISRESARLSGTTKCPFKIPRKYTCSDCKYHDGYDEDLNGLCNNEEYISLNKEGRAMEHYIEGEEHCKFFDKNEWADKYDKNTGEIIWDDLKKINNEVIVCQKKS